MVLAVDIGNSNICIGGLAGEAHRDILFTTRMVTRPRCTADEYAAELRFLLGRLKVDPTACEGVIVCSVVPGLTPVLAHACKRLTGRDALIVSNALDTGLTFAVDEPDRVGRDRLADAAAAAAHYPLPCMTVDMGTATTYNVLSAEGCFLGGFIVPGVQTSLRAISAGTAQLPPIAPEPPEHLVGRNTVEALNNGAMFGTAAMLDGLVPFTAMDGTRFLATGEDCGRESRRLNGGSLYGYYETKDGEYLSVGSLEPKFWAAFCTGIGCPDLIEGTVEPENIDAVRERVRGVLKTKTRDEWTAIFQELDCCVEPVLSLKEALLEDEHIQERNLVVEVEVPCTGGKKVKQLGSPMKLSECPVTYDLGGYPLGYHTQEVMGALGLDYAALKAEGVFD